MTPILVTKIRYANARHLGVNFELYDSTLFRIQDVERPAGSLDNHIETPFTALAEIEGTKVTKLVLPELPLLR